MTTAAIQPGQVSLGWQHELLHADPGLPPRRPVPPDPERLNPDWLAAQRREETLISRPARQAAACGVLLAGVAVLLGWAGWLNPLLTGLGVVTFVGLAAAGTVSAWRGRQGLKAAIAAETRRVAAARAAQERDLFAAQEEHARRFRAWQSRQRAFRGQALWYPVVLPEQTDRVDLVGGTMAGWSALLTSVGVPRLAGGDAITVLDLSEGAVARDLVALAGPLGVGPLVWVLPGDLPRFDLGVGLPATAMADILTACASADRAAAGGHDPAPDHALLARLLEVLGDGAQICQVTAALRALAQVGDPREDVRRGGSPRSSLTASPGCSAAARRTGWSSSGPGHWRRGCGCLSVSAAIRRRCRGAGYGWCPRIPAAARSATACWRPTSRSPSATCSARPVPGGRGGTRSAWPGPRCSPGS